jgi:hypothetical protein
MITHSTNKEFAMKQVLTKTARAITAAAAAQAARTTTAVFLPLA